MNFVSRISDGEMAILVRRKAVNLKYDAVAVVGRLVVGNRPGYGDSWGVAIGAAL